MCNVYVFGRILGMSSFKYILVSIYFHAMCAEWNTVKRVIL